jgi:glycosyltransferase involved in cell wall biosynthesis
MRVAIFTDNDFDKVNGVTTTLKAVLKHTAGLARPRIYTAADLPVETPEYFAVPSAGVGLPYYREMRIYWPRLTRLARALRHDEVDVVHITTPGPVGLAGRWLGRKLGLPVVGSYHTHLGDYARLLSGSDRLGAWTDAYLRWFYGLSDSVLVPSRAAARLLASRGYAANRLRVWPRGVDADAFSPRKASADWRRRWKVDPRRPAILYVGRLSPEKGLALMPKLQRLLHRAAVAHQFVFVGDGPMGALLRQEMPDAVFLGALSHADVAVAMASADLFLFPSATDTFGNVVLEAQASGLPTLVTSEGGPAERVVDSETGYISTPGDVRAVADTVIPLLRSQVRRQRMGEAAREWAEQHTWRAAMEPLLAAWRDAQRATAPVAGGLVLDPSHSLSR